MKYNSGFIALTSVLILSAIFVSVTVSMASRSISGSLLTTAFIERDMAQFYAEACVDHALIELLRTVNYAGNDTIVVGDGSCTILPIEGSGPTNRIIKTLSSVGAHTYRAEVIVESISPEVRITSYERVTQF